MDDETTAAGPGVGLPFDLADAPVGLSRTPGGTTAFGVGVRGPFRVDGVTVGAARMDRDPPHLGELHPDGDELLYLVEGAVDVVLGVDERGEGGETTSLVPGQAFVVPQGVWHRVLVREPSHLVHVTPGPGSDHHPLPPDDPRWEGWR